MYLDGFSYLNKLEESVLEQVMRQAESVTVTLLGDRAEGTLFQNALRQRQRLERMARQLGTECEIVWLTGSGKGPLAHLEKHLLGEDVPYEGDDCRQQVALWECGTVYGEVERTAAQIRKLVASRACRWRDIAVTARNMEVYGPVIESVFQRDGIPGVHQPPQRYSGKAAPDHAAGGGGCRYRRLPAGGYVPLSQDGDGGHHGGGM